MVDLGVDNLRAKAYGKYIQGLAHGTIAVLYDSGFVYDETVQREDLVLAGYPDVMTAALGYFADAATLAWSGSFTMPATWMGQDVTSDMLARLAHASATRFSVSR